MNITKLKSLLVAADNPENDNVPTLIPGVPEDDLLIAMRNCLPELLAVVEAADWFTNSYRNQDDHKIRGIDRLLEHYDALELALTALEERLEQV